MTFKDIRQVIYWTALFVSPLSVMSEYSADNKYLLSNFYPLFFLLFVIYLLSLIFFKKIMKVINITFWRFILTNVLYVLVGFIFFLVTLFQMFPVDYIVQGTYANPPSHFFAFGGGYGYCADLTDCIYLSKYVFALVNVLDVVFCYILAVLLERFFIKLRAKFTK